MKISCSFTYFRWRNWAINIVYVREHIHHDGTGQRLQQDSRQFSLVRIYGVLLNSSWFLVMNSHFFHMCFLLFSLIVDLKAKPTSSNISWFLDVSQPSPGFLPFHMYGPCRVRTSGTSAPRSCGSAGASCMDQRGSAEQRWSFVRFWRGKKTKAVVLRWDLMGFYGGDLMRFHWDFMGSKNWGFIDGN